MRSTLLSAQGSNAFAEMTELADVQDLGSCAIRREGSSPFFRMENVYSFPLRERIQFSLSLEKEENIVYDEANSFYCFLSF